MCQAVIIDPRLQRGIAIVVLEIMLDQAVRSGVADEEAITLAEGHIIDRFDIFALEKIEEGGRSTISEVTSTIIKEVPEVWPEEQLHCLPRRRLCFHVHFVSGVAAALL